MSQCQNRDPNQLDERTASASSPDSFMYSDSIDSNRDSFSKQPVQAIDGLQNGSPDGRNRRSLTPHKKSRAIDQINTEMPELVRLLATKHANWKERLSALRRIQRFSSFPVPAPVLSEALQPLIEPLGVQVDDLRSQIVKQATNTIADLAECLRFHFEPFADVLFPKLCGLTRIAKKVMSSAGDECMRRIVSNAQICSISYLISESTQNKSPLVRCRCIEYIDLAFEHWDIQHLALFRTAIAASFPHICSDATKGVRTAARRLFASFMRAWPEAGEEVLSNLPMKVQQSIFHEYPEANLHPDNKTESVVGVGSTPKKKSRLQSLLAWKRRAMEEKKQKEAKVSQDSSSDGIANSPSGLSTEDSRRKLDEHREKVQSPTFRDLLDNSSPQSEPTCSQLASASRMSPIPSDVLHQLGIPSPVSPAALPSPVIASFIEKRRSLRTRSQSPRKPSSPTVIGEREEDFSSLVQFWADNATSPHKENLVPSASSTEDAAEDAAPPSSDISKSQERYFKLKMELSRLSDCIYEFERSQTPIKSQSLNSLPSASPMHSQKVRKDSLSCNLESGRESQHSVHSQHTSLAADTEGADLNKTIVENEFSLEELQCDDRDDCSVDMELCGEDECVSSPIRVLVEDTLQSAEDGPPLLALSGSIDGGDAATSAVPSSAAVASPEAKVLSPLASPPVSVSPANASATTPPAMPPRSRSSQSATSQSGTPAHEPAPSFFSHILSCILIAITLYYFIHTRSLSSTGMVRESSSLDAQHASPNARLWMKNDPSSVDILNGEAVLEDSVYTASDAVERTCANGIQSILVWSASEDRNLETQSELNIVSKCLAPDEYLKIASSAMDPVAELKVSPSPPTAAISSPSGRVEPFMLDTPFEEVQESQSETQAPESMSPAADVVPEADLDSVPMRPEMDSIPISVIEPGTELHSSQPETSADAVSETETTATEPGILPEPKPEPNSFVHSIVYATLAAIAGLLLFIVVGVFTTQSKHVTFSSNATTPHASNSRGLEDESSTTPDRRVDFERIPYNTSTNGTGSYHTWQVSETDGLEYTVWSPLRRSHRIQRQHSG